MLILQGDSTQIPLASASVQALIADPPYGVDYQRHDKKAQKPKILNDLDPCITWFDEAYRVMQPHTPLICFCHWRFSENFKIAMQLAGFLVKDQMIWDRIRYGMADLQTHISPSHEVMWFATKDSYRFPEGTKRLRSVLSEPRVHATRDTHPNQKPVKLLETLLLGLTRPTDLVLDPFCGSGSTGVACANTGRRFIGIDLDPTWTKHAHSALSPTLPMRLDAQTEVIR